jgi:hypothetical protein
LVTTTLGAPTDDAVLDEARAAPGAMNARARFVIEVNELPRLAKATAAGG